MSNLSVNVTSFAARLSPVAAERLQESKQVSDEIVTLQNRFNEEFGIGENEGASEEITSNRRITDFVSDQLLNGENSNEAVAFLLDLADQELNPRGGIETQIESQLTGNRQNFANREPTLTDVLDLANETFRQIRERNAPIGLQLSVITEAFEGLQQLRA